MKLFSILIALGVLSSTQIIELPITKNVELSKPLNKLHEICLETDDLTENGIKAAGDYKYETVLLTNSGNMVYTGALLFGTPKQGNMSSKFLFDSSTSYTTVTTAQCLNCNTTYYNYTLSYTYQAVSGGITELSFELPSE
jgi:hypothetical protein